MRFFIYHQFFIMFSREIQRPQKLHKVWCIVEADNLFWRYGKKASLRKWLWYKDKCKYRTSKSFNWNYHLYEKETTWPSINVLLFDNLAKVFVIPFAGKHRYCCENWIYFNVETKPMRLSKFSNKLWATYYTNWEII